MHCGICERGLLCYGLFRGIGAWHIKVDHSVSLHLKKALVKVVFMADVNCKNILWTEVLIQIAPSPILH